MADFNDPEMAARLAALRGQTAQNPYGAPSVDLNEAPMVQHPNAVNKPPAYAPEMFQTPQMGKRTGSAPAPLRPSTNKPPRY